MNGRTTKEARSVTFKAEGISAGAPSSSGAQDPWQGVEGQDPWDGSSGQWGDQGGQDYHTQMIVATIKALKDAGVLGNGGGQGSSRGIMESKAWKDVEKLGSDRTQYRKWREKFKNAQDEGRGGDEEREEKFKHK